MGTDEPRDLPPGWQRLQPADDGCNTACNPPGELDLRAIIAARIADANKYLTELAMYTGREENKIEIGMPELTVQKHSAIVPISDERLHAFDEPDIPISRIHISRWVRIRSRIGGRVWDARFWLAKKLAGYDFEQEEE